MPFYLPLFFSFYPSSSFLLLFLSTNIFFYFNGLPLLSLHVPLSSYFFPCSRSRSYFMKWRCFAAPNHSRALDNVMRYRRELKTGLVKRFEHVKAEEDKKLTEAYAKTTMNKLCREERLRKVRLYTSHIVCFAW